MMNREQAIAYYQAQETAEPRKSILDMRPSATWFILRALEHKRTIADVVRILRWNAAHCMSEKRQAVYEQAVRDISEEQHDASK